MNEDNEISRNENPGLFLLALPEPTLQLVRKMSRIMGKSLPDVISESLQILWEKHQKQLEEHKEAQEDVVNKKKKVKFR